ncbi:NADH:flavin oxidoreductase [Mesorhizobium sp. DCY119]|uniref:NADH:flavin oxidoreductase n=1 Tax=Mesorhizobium sp. DCY119 TaxID=2108445 RepID=UPI000E715F8E|nr:NADH:flavin oxidoreductase [Mesorhizobium sp. DCY119]RJG39895.1 12-oxophytodienoate reductase [Mesorhizobium sp. DCY119]
MPSIANAVLFQPFRIKSLELKNRIVMAPMTRFQAPSGIPDERNAAYYQRRAEGEVGLILSEGTVVARPASRNHDGIPFFHGETALAGWKTVIDAVHQAGGRMGPQIWHTGSAEPVDSSWRPDGTPEGPSGLLAPGLEHGKTMSEEDIADTVAAFAAAAADSKRLGFDTVEIHAAHGYLVDQFFWSGTNERKDSYGGPTIRDRSHFAAEIVREMRRAVGPDFPIVMRVSQWKLKDYEARLAETPQALEQWLLPMVEAGIDILHCSQRRFWEPEFPELDGENGLNLAGWAKKVTGTPTISVGSVGLTNDFLSSYSGEHSNAATLDQLIRRMERDEFDLIAVGRALIGDSHWVEKVRSGQHETMKGFDPTAIGQLV